MQRTTVVNLLRKTARSILEKDYKGGPYTIPDKGVVKLLENIIHKIK